MPVTLTDANPGVVVDGTVTVRVVLTCPPEARLMLLLVRAAVIVPYMLVERLTLPEKPRTLVRVMVDWPVWPSLMDSKEGLATIWKSGPVTLTSR